jgi:hypothetical protein
LETVEHLLDHAERREPTRNHSLKTVSGENRICIASERLGFEASHIEAPGTSKCNVGLVTEEVVETMIIGQAPFNATLDGNHAEDIALGTTGRGIAKRRSRFIILDVAHYEKLGFRLSASSYGRILMNLFGNALKFTESGYIHVSVRCEDLDEKKGTLVLRISDSGIGMSKQFLMDAFEPFRKQSQHTSGTGVGLSVVKRILEDVGGAIDVSSELSKGTDITLKLPLDRLAPEEHNDQNINPLPSAVSTLKGRKVCILYGGIEKDDSPEHIEHKKTLERYVAVLSDTLSGSLKLNVYHAAEWDGSDDTEIVVCPEVSFDSLQKIRSSAAKAGRRCPAAILISMDILEAETLRSDARVTSKESIVESVTQP